MSERCQQQKSRLHELPKEKPPKAALNSNLMMADHAAINAGFALRR
jgi:hypothetical protein